jgi:hypothetical protein
MSEETYNSLLGRFHYHHMYSNATESVPPWLTLSRWEMSSYQVLGGEDGEPGYY